MARKGLPKSIIKKYGISKKAWRVFRGKKKKPHKYSIMRIRRKKSNPKRRTRRMGKKKRRGGKSLQRTIFKWIRIGAIVAPGAAIALSKKSNEAKMEEIVEAYFGYNIPQKRMVWSSLLRGWGPFIGATLVTYGIPKIAGILRRI